ncbi:PHP domain-containing protein [Aeromicrobium sp. CF4.19]|uniref:PHP domain-containing protein n=1 Tax=Aeromicrobium sp. CF4.19 TaxID=3373082 RepID=UPI003EE7B7A1
MRIDLHTHSDRSDGTDSPRALVHKAAREAALDVVALTDHDATTGWAEARLAADEVGITLVEGVEISTTYRGASVHLLGYAFDPDDAALVEELRRVRAGRDERLPRILAKLAEAGMPLTEADVLVHSENAAATGRPHVADAMVAAGYVKDRTSAFDGWLNTGGRAHVERYSAPLEQAIDLVKGAGGRTVVAHPWSRESRAVLDLEVFAHLRSLGLDGIEVDHVDHDPASRAGLRAIATELDLVMTGSSDYHGTGKSEAFSLGANLTDPGQHERLLG